jgi:hypothetical protein
MSRAPDALSLFQPYETALPKIAVAGVGPRILELRRGERLTLIGLGSEEVVSAIKATTVGARSALLLEPAGGRTSEGILDHLLNDLADIALGRWPLWYGWGMSRRHMGSSIAPQPIGLYLLHGCARPPNARVRAIALGSAKLRNPSNSCS